jgi:hypothetical protein
MKPDGPVNVRGQQRLAGVFDFVLEPTGKHAVASVKHCSILALSVLCSASSKGQARKERVFSARKGAEERDVCYG